MKNVMYYYSDHESQNRIAIAGMVNAENELQLAVSRCSKKDNFNRKVGRNIAEGRLLKGKLFRTVGFSDDSPVTIKDFATEAKIIENELLDVKSNIVLVANDN